MGEQIELLEHHAHFHAEFRHIGFGVENIYIVHSDFTGVGMLQQVQAAQESALSRSGRTDDGDDLSPGDFGIHVAEHRSAVITFLQMLDGNHQFFPPFAAERRFSGSSRNSR